MNIIEKNGKFFITDSRGKIRSKAFADKDDAEDTLYAWEEEAAFDRETYGVGEDSPCLDMSQYHGPHNG